MEKNPPDADGARADWPAFTLADRLPADRAAALAASLLALRGGRLTLDGERVAQITTPCVQVLLAAARTWAEDGVPLRIVRASPALRATLATLAIDAAALGIAAPETA